MPGYHEQKWHPITPDMQFCLNLWLKQAPGYFSVIKQPMDFTTMRRKLAAGQYSNYDDMEADLNLMFTNCMTYNPEGGCC